MYYFGCFLISLLICVAKANLPNNLPIDSDFLNEFSETRADPIQYRLPNNTAPNSYSIKLETTIDKGDFNFTGEVTINLRALEATNKITLHARQLTVDQQNIKLTQLTGFEIDINAVTYQEDREFLTIETGENLVKGDNYLLTIKYNGTLREDKGGFYRSSYDDADKKKR